MAVHCPDCGSELPSDAAIEGLCPQCLLSLALRGSSPDLDELETLDGPSPGRILGGRYQMRELLGRGGMGEVWRAFDLKLRVDVALKAIRPERAESARAQELLRQEVRSAREVVSPNVCRIFDLVAEEGRELVSMEYVDGTTLAETLRTRGPLQLQEAREIASQFLSGLEAIHAAGLVHRDFKPENVMITRAGRVVVMDFGLAKGRAEAGTGTVSGTPAYMSPEQARGEPVDARADVFAAGVVLAEMLSVGGEGIRSRLLVMPFAGGAAREIHGILPPESQYAAMALGDDGRLAAVAPSGGPLEQQVVRVVDLETGASRALPAVPGTFAETGEGFEWLQFVGPDRLLASVARRGLLLYDLRDGTGRLVASQPRGEFVVGRKKGVCVGIDGSPGRRPTGLVRFSLDGRPPQALRSHGSQVNSVALDPTETRVATGSQEGTVRVGPVSGEEPHLFLGHEGSILAIAFSPDGQWLASAATDKTIRLWPMPDVSAVPLHKRPHADLLARLRSRTNVRAVPDPASPTGWKLDQDPFPGWGKPPE